MTDRPSSTSWRTIVVAALAITAAASSAPLVAQQGTTLGIGFGPIASYPAEFGGSGCEAHYVGANVAVRRALSARVAAEASVAWTGSVSTSCLADALSRPAPQDGETYRYASIPDAINGETFWATRIGAVVTPWEPRTVTPLLRVTGGRLWSKELWTWTFGGGARFALGRHGIVLDVERWHLGYEVTEESWTFRENGPDELQLRETVDRRPRPWFVRVGWDITVG